MGPKSRTEKREGEMDPKTKMGKNADEKIRGAESLMGAGSGGLFINPKTKMGKQEQKKGSRVPNGSWEWWRWGSSAVHRSQCLALIHLGKVKIFRPKSCQEMGANLKGKWEHFVGNLGQTKVKIPNSKSVFSAIS